jgi:RsiW-degrading membrane proteinase PrsW (M82 family)
VYLFVLALAPSLLWLWWFWKQEVEDREEARPLARAFLFGALSAIPAAIVEVALGGGSPGGNWIQCLFVIGPVEELAKWYAMKRAVWDDPSFDQPADGIVYAAASALGFAFAENLGYFSGAGSGLVLVRTFLSVPCHVLFAVPWGAATGRLKLIPGTERAVLMRGLALGMLLHGLFDGFLFNIGHHPFLFLVGFVALVRYQWVFFRRTMKEALASGIQKQVMPDVPVSEPATGATGLLTAHAAATEEAPPLWDAPPPPKPAPDGLQWKYVGLSALYGCVLLVLSVGLAINIMGNNHGEKENLVLGQCVILSQVLAGLISAYRSPGRTVRESSLGLGLLGVGFSLLAPGMLTAVIPLMILGAFGGWLGEALQGSS